jgi:para-nitrobenzyl esterase
VLRPHDINHYFGEEATGEDCLTATCGPMPRRVKSARGGVLYGGGFTIGSSGTANYDGEAMAKAARLCQFQLSRGAMGFSPIPN